MMQPPMCLGSASPLGIVLLLAALAPACGDRRAAREEPATPATSSNEEAKPFPRLETGQAWVSSVPVGLKLYVDGGAEEKFLKGLTPQIVTLAPGPHTVTIVTAPGVAPIVDRSRGFTQEARVGLPTGQTAVTYGIQKQADTALSVIVLAFPEGVTHDRLADHYPRDVMFPPPPAGRAAIYGMIGVPQAQRDLATSLLARGGKVRLDVEASWLFLEEQPLSPDKSLSVANVPKNGSTGPGR